MTNPVRRFFAAVWKWAKMRPSREHMKGLRDEVSRRDVIRLAQDAARQR